MSIARRWTNDDGVKTPPPIASWMDRFDLTPFERSVLFVLAVTAAPHGDDGAVDSYTDEESIAMLVSAPESKVRAAIARLVALRALQPVTLTLAVPDAEIVHEGFELLGFERGWT